MTRNATDEEWENHKLQKAQFKDMAKNPPESMTVYRMQGGDPSGSLGIHWSTDQNVAHYTGLGGAGDDRTVHRATVKRDQLISQGEWMNSSMPVRTYHTDDAGKVVEHPSQWGLGSEAEVRLRPGATVTDHATAPQGVHDYTPTGREPTIEARGSFDFMDLVHHAVQGTPEAARLDDLQSVLPHVQQVLFDKVINNENDAEIGYTPKWSTLRGSMSLGEAIDFGEKDVNRIGAGAGLPKWGASTESMREPPLAELMQRSRSDEFHGAHQAAHNPDQLQLDLGGV